MFWPRLFGNADVFFRLCTGVNRVSLKGGVHPVGAVGPLLPADRQRVITAGCSHYPCLCCCLLRTQETCLQAAAGGNVTWVQILFGALSDGNCWQIAVDLWLVKMNEGGFGRDWREGGGYFHWTVKRPLRWWWWWWSSFYFSVVIRKSRSQPAFTFLNEI